MADPTDLQDSNVMTNDCTKDQLSELKPWVPFGLQSDFMTDISQRPQRM